MFYAANTAIIVGDVTVEKDVSLWHYTVLRGDFEAIWVGEATNLQDGAVIHADLRCPTSVGRRVTVGHGAIIHACEVGDDCIIGMNSVLSSRSLVGKGSIVAPGAVIPEGREFPPESLLGGVPAQVIRRLDEADNVRIEASWRAYVELAQKSLERRAELKGSPEARTKVSFLEDAEP